MQRCLAVYFQLKLQADSQLINSLSPYPSHFRFSSVTWAHWSLEMNSQQINVSMYPFPFPALLYLTSFMYALLFTSFPFPYLSFSLRFFPQNRFAETI